MAEEDIPRPRLALILSCIKRHEKKKRKQERCNTPTPKRRFSTASQDRPSTCSSPRPRVDTRNEPFVLPEPSPAIHHGPLQRRRFVAHDHQPIPPPPRPVTSSPQRGRKLPRRQTTPSPSLKPHLNTPCNGRSITGSASTRATYPATEAQPQNSITPNRTALQSPASSTLQAPVTPARNSPRTVKEAFAARGPTCGRSQAEAKQGNRTGGGTENDQKNGQRLGDFDGTFRRREAVGLGSWDTWVAFFCPRPLPG